MHRQPLILAALLFGAGNKPSPPPVTAVTPAAAPAARAQPDPLAAQRALALSPPDGTERLDQQIVRIQENARLNPEKVDNWVALGEAWLRKARESLQPERYQQASAAADLALDVAPGFPMALDLKGLVALNDHRFQDARALAEKALAKDPDDVLGLGLLSDALLELGDFDGSVKAAEHMMELKPGLPAYSRAAHLKWLQGDAKGAQEAARLAIDASAIGESSAWALTDAANMFFALGDVEGAEAGYDMALTRMGNFPPALVGKARVAMVRGKPKDAVPLAQKAMELQPLGETAWVLGDALLATGQKDAAEKAYSEVEKHGRAGDRRTWAYFLAVKNEKIDDAVKLIERELQGRGDHYTRDVASWVFYRAGRLEDARRESDAAMKEGTLEPRFFWHAGAIRIAQGDKKEGVALVQKALKQHPHFDVTQADEARALLAKQGVKGGR